MPAQPHALASGFGGVGKIVIEGVNAPTGRFGPRFSVLRVLELGKIFGGLGDAGFECPLGTPIAACDSDRLKVAELLAVVMRMCLRHIYCGARCIRMRQSSEKTKLWRHSGDRYPIVS
ncbi:hypothetical protein [Mesorhizobium sp.]|uniref:hypothetical protein n=1 Tax=Mesorhizobium sp. TaxID=1871066 RepID=UPI0025D00C85|nr:hypothetical protein [Mesorhizobium sp.]